jgi:predicted permease
MLFHEVTQQTKIHHASLDLSCTFIAATAAAAAIAATVLSRLFRPTRRWIFRSSVFSLPMATHASKPLRAFGALRPQPET